MFTKGLAFLSYALPALASSLESRQAASLASCPGYSASNLKDDGSTVTADLTLAGTACNAYGEDITNLKLLVEYQTGTYSPQYFTAILTSHRTTPPRQDLRPSGTSLSDSGVRLATTFQPSRLAKWFSAGFRVDERPVLICDYATKQQGDAVQYVSGELCVRRPVCEVEDEFA
jgi:hypothetical protein